MWPPKITNLKSFLLYLKHTFHFSGYSGVWKGPFSSTLRALGLLSKLHGQGCLWSSESLPLQCQKLPFKWQGMVFSSNPQEQTTVFSLPKRTSMDPRWQHMQVIKVELILHIIHYSFIRIPPKMAETRIKGRLYIKPGPVYLATIQYLNGEVRYWTCSGGFSLWARTQNMI